MSQATSVFAPSRGQSPTTSALALARIAAVVVAIVLAVALVVVLALAWLRGDAPDLYASLPSYCAPQGKADVLRVDASGAAGTEAPGWVDVVRSISAAKGAGESKANPASKGRSD